MASSLIERLKGGLIVSCQAREGSPFHGPQFMAAFAIAAEMGGAVGVRVNGGADVRAVRSSVTLPIIGINKQRSGDLPVYITPTLDAARQIVDAGAEIVAIDATHRPRKDNVKPEDLINAIKREFGCLVMADIDSFEEGAAAALAGADLVATTLSGYTGNRPMTYGPDFELVRTLAADIQVPVICEGRIRNPDDVAAAFAAGAYAVVVGTAITNPIAITQTFAEAAPRNQAPTE